MKNYTHVNVLDVEAALDKLPGVIVPERDEKGENRPAGRESEDEQLRGGALCRIHPTYTRFRDTAVFE